MSADLGNSRRSSLPPGKERLVRFGSHRRIRHVERRSCSRCRASKEMPEDGWSALAFSFSSCSESSGTACWLSTLASEGREAFWPGKKDIGIAPEGVVGAERDSHRFVLLRELGNPNGTYNLPLALPTTLDKPWTSPGLEGRCRVASLELARKTGIWFTSWQGTTAVACPLDKRGSCCILSNNSRNWRTWQGEHSHKVIMGWNSSLFLSLSLSTTFPSFIPRYFRSCEKQIDNTESEWTRLIAVRDGSKISPAENRRDSQGDNRNKEAKRLIDKTEK